MAFEGLGVEDLRIKHPSIVFSFSGEVFSCRAVELRVLRVQSALALLIQSRFKVASEEGWMCSNISAPQVCQDFADPQSR